MVKPGAAAAASEAEHIEKTDMSPPTEKAEQIQQSIAQPEEEADKDNKKTADATPVPAEDESSYGNEPSASSAGAASNDDGNEAAAAVVEAAGNISSESPGPSAEVVASSALAPNAAPESLAPSMAPKMPGKMIRRTSTSSSSSKVHDAIQDIINQFDPLKVSASTSQLPAEAEDAPSEQSAGDSALSEEEQQRRRQTELRAKFEPETDGFNYNDFLQQLRHPAAKPVARTVKNFLTEFSRRPMTLTEQVRFVHDFLEFVASKMRECTVWQHASEREFDNAREGMEKLVMNRLYHLCFSPSTSDDADKDHVLREKMSLFRWIREDHLDIQQSPQNATFLQFAKTELLKINNFKSPRDKVICILNCCTVIYALLRNARDQSRPEDGDVGADRFLPLLIYVVITACPPKLVSNLQYIMRFRSADRMQSEAGYYVTNLQGAVAFIESMDASCLSIPQDEFDRNIEMTIWEMEMEKRTKERSQQQKQLQPHQQSLQQPVADQQYRQPQNNRVLRQTQYVPQQPGADASGERGQWLLDRSSDLARSTLEKTNNFVGRLISEFSTPAISESGQSTPARAGTSSNALPQYPGEPQQQQQQQDDDDDEVGDAELVGPEEWKANLMIVRDMFPNIDADVVEIVFESNRGVVPRTIEQLLDMAATNEALEVARENSIGDVATELTDRSHNASGTGAGSDGVASVLGGEDDVDEMERWKGQWADDDSDDDGSDGTGHGQLNQNKSAGSSEIDDHHALQAPTGITHNASSAAGDTSTSKVNATVDQPSGASIPDTSGDEELARKLQMEFELQARQEAQARQASHPHPEQE
ncbi:hypothetical protein GGI25_002906 [Coemansia spiralis]|uniref:Uncharacterized protein n=1 Tax=Coemansia spiralis TaxID=417178 RepID=A0A9W8KYX5_9FUNG|nr:hypothetical protein GGI25_002906 [Coemansia spiralis]